MLIADPRQAAESKHWRLKLSRECVLVAAVVVGVAGCSDSVEPAATERPAFAAAADEKTKPGPTDRPNEFPSVIRADVELTATGQLVPGAPVMISAVGSARFAAPKVEVVLTMADYEPGAASGQRTVLGRWAGALSPGARSAEIGRPIVWSRPGYYRVTARVENTPTDSDPREVGDTTIIDLHWRHLWIIIDSLGGRLTNGYEASAIPQGYYPLHGSYGPFVRKIGNPLSQLGAAPQSGFTGNVDLASASVARTDVPRSGGLSSSGFTVTGTFRYNDLDQAGEPLVPVPGAKITATCYTTSPPLLQADASTVTASNGSFILQCPSGYAYVNGSAHFTNSNAVVEGENGASAGAAVFSAGPGNLDLVAGNEIRRPGCSSTLPNGFPRSTRSSDIRRGQ